MRKYEKSIDNRKLLVGRLSELTGLESRYTFVPRCAYVVGSFTVEKDGTLTVEDGADEQVLSTLISEGMIGAELEIAAPARPAEALEAPAQVAARNTAAVESTEEWEDEDWEEAPETTAEAETTVESVAEEEQEIWRPDTDIFSERLPETSTTPTFVPIASEADAGYEQVEEGSATSLEMPEAAGMTTETPLDASFSFPLSKHTATSLINLICMIHSRGNLISKATKGEFFASKALTDDLLDHPAFVKAKDVADYLKERENLEEELIGLSFDEGKVTFDGFGTAKDAEHLQTFMKLAAAMNRMAITQKRVQAKNVDDSNEKYALRIWLIRLGLNGDEFKADRKRLMANLTGHTAFRSEEEKDRWTAKQAAKRDALRAAKAAAQTEQNAV